jgi:apolipoprotein N-acyltransferase
MIVPFSADASKEVPAVAQAGPFVWLVAGALLAGLVARSTIPPAIWLALTLLLHASRSMHAWPGLALVWLALFAAFALENRGTVPGAGAAYAAIVFFLATTMALPFVIDRTVVLSPGLASTLVFPIGWVAVEFLRSRLTPSATWYSIAYTQYGHLALMQVAAFIGIWGISFVVAWGASTLETAWSSGFDWSATRTPLLVYGAVLCVLVLAGHFRVAYAPTDRASIRAATLNRPLDLFVPGEITRIAEGRLAHDERQRLGGKLAMLHDWFLEGSRREARAGARVIVWPETNLLIYAEDEPAFLERARRLSADERVYLAMGMGTVHVGAAMPLENKLVLVDPSGEILASYLKSHAVSGWEAGIMRRGDGVLPVMPTSLGRIAGAICFDADFPEFMRQAAQGSADLLVLPVNEWKEIKGIHFQMHAFRAIETGVPLVRAASSGLSAVFDPWGRVLGIADYFAAGDGTLTVQLPIGRIQTVYARTGDLFAWLCVAGLVVAIGAGRVF